MKRALPILLLTLTLVVITGCKANASENVDNNITKLKGEYINTTVDKNDNSIAYDNNIKKSETLKSNCKNVENFESYNVKTKGKNDKINTLNNKNSEQHYVKKRVNIGNKNSKAYIDDMGYENFENLKRDQLLRNSIRTMLNRRVPCIVEPIFRIH